MLIVFAGSFRSFPVIQQSFRSNCRIPGHLFTYPLNVLQNEAYKNKRSHCYSTRCKWVAGYSAIKPERQITKKCKSYTDKHYFTSFKGKNMQISKTLLSKSCCHETLWLFLKFIWQQFHMTFYFMTIFKRFWVFSEIQDGDRITIYLITTSCDVIVPLCWPQRRQFWTYYVPSSFNFLKLR